VCLKAGRGQLRLPHGTKTKAVKGKKTGNKNWIFSEEMVSN